MTIDCDTPRRQLLALLEARAGQVVFADEIIAAIGARWGEPHKVLWVAIARARDSLPPGCEILTIQGQGYMLRRR